MTLGETLIKTLMDTLLGMGSVFIILIIICLIISLFKFIPGNGMKLAQESAAPKKEPAAVPETEDEEDGEITAVILAAIRMSMERHAMETGAVSGVPAEEPKYTVRSIKRKR